VSRRRQRRRGSGRTDMSAAASRRSGFSHKPKAFLDFAEVVSTSRSNSPTSRWT
jgi:hypothetical protein